MEAQEQDPVRIQITAYFCQGRPHKCWSKDTVIPYRSSKGELSVVQNILLKASRTIIPSSIHPEILDKIHEGHQEITKCRERAKTSVCWPKKLRIWCNIAEFFNSNLATPGSQSHLYWKWWLPLNPDMHKFKKMCKYSHGHANNPGSTGTLWENQTLWKKTINPWCHSWELKHWLNFHQQFRLRMQLMRFHSKKIKDVTGKKIYIAIVLSRRQTRNQTMKLTIDNDKNHTHIGSVISSLPAWDVWIQHIMEAQEKYPVCEGRPDKCLSNNAMKLWSSRSELSLVQNIALKASRIVIPSSMHLEILDKIHEGHQGITKMP